MMTLITELEKAIADEPMMRLPNLIGQLAALQARAQLRLISGNRAETEVALLTVPQVAEQLKVSNYRAYELARQGELKIVRLGKSVRVKPSAVAEYLAKHGGC
jgi:excisionase family DNA binding protein